MSLNKSKGNMYSFINYTWNTVKGECYHNCSYCYMKRWGKLKPVHFDEKELKTDLGSGNFIFVVSGGDLFAEDIPAEWITKTLAHCHRFDNKYLFQTKNPKRMLNFRFPNAALCTTIESDIFYPEIMGNSPKPQERAKYMEMLSGCGFMTFVTIEPILDFNLVELVKLIKQCRPEQVNIGSDSGRHNLPEPPKEKVLQLIDELAKFTIVHDKANLKRLFK